MDWLTFFAICVVSVPLQITLILSLFWLRQKFDKYEAIAIGIINKYNMSHTGNLNSQEKINIIAHRNQKRALIDQSMQAIAHTLKNRYRENGILNHEIMGRTAITYITDDWLDNNPLISAALDLLSGAWLMAES